MTGSCPSRLFILGLAHQGFGRFLGGACRLHMQQVPVQCGIPRSAVVFLPPSIANTTYAILLLPPFLDLQLSTFSSCNSRLLRADLEIAFSRFFRRQVTEIRCLSPLQ